MREAARFWLTRACCLLAAAASLTAACSSGSKPTSPSAPAGTIASPSVTAAAAATAPARARPAGVPASAQPVQAPRQFGMADAGGSAPQLLYSQTCTNGVLTLATTSVVLYAELPCDRALPESVVHRFLGQPLRVRVVPGEPGKLYLESPQAGSVEFTVGGVWADGASGSR